MGLPNIGPLELIIILAVLLLVVGPRRLPEMGQAVGRTIREFRKASTDITDSATITPDSTVAAPSSSASAALPSASAAPSSSASAALPSASAALPSASAAPASSASAVPEPNTLSDQATPNVTVQAQPDDAADPGMDRNDDATRPA